MNYQCQENKLRKAVMIGSCPIGLTPFQFALRGAWI